MKKLFLVICLLGVAVGPGFSAEKPNVIWIIADDVGWKDIGCYGHPVIRTPNIDWLAEHGVRFTHAFVTSPQCSPSRTAMFSGRFAHTVGAEDLHDPVPEGVQILPTYLRQAGYWTGNVGKLHLGRYAAAQFNVVRGFDRGGDLVGQWSAFLDERPRERPFFLAIGFTEAHRPFTKRPQKPYRPEEVVIPPYLPEHPVVREDLAAYYNEITYMDEQIGLLLRRLREDGLLENTVIFFFSDNGSPFPRCKCHLADSGVGTPLIVYWPGVAPAGTVHHGLVSLVDLSPTVLEIAGVEVPGDWTGVSFDEAIREPASSGKREAVFLERNWHDYEDHVRAVRTDRFKLVRNVFLNEPWMPPADVMRGPTARIMLRLREQAQLTVAQMMLFRAPRPPVELYDLTVDPWEFQNVAFEPEYWQIRERLERTLDEWIKETRDVSPWPRRPDEFDRWTGQRLRRQE